MINEIDQSNEQTTVKNIAPMPLQSLEIGEITTALSIAQGMMENAKKSESNPFFKSRYADLSEILAVARMPLSKNDLCVTQSTLLTHNGGIILKTMVAHKSGQWIAGYYPVKPIKEDPQGYGSAMTYARRYTYASMIGVGQEDDDGEKAVSHEKAPASGLILKCTIHNAAMKEYISEKTGNPYFSHETTTGKCFGKT